MKLLTTIALAIGALAAVPAASAQDNDWIKKTIRQQRLDEPLWRRASHRYADDGYYTWRRYRPKVVVVVKDPELRWAQETLQELDYDVEPDGVMGPQTRRALTKFQRDFDLPVTGILDKRTKEALRDDERVDEDKDTDAPSKMVWARRPDICEMRDGRQCTCDPIIVFSGEHRWANAKDEGRRRWRGYVRSVLGELWMHWSAAENPDVKCWHSATGERVSDSTQERCMAMAHACLGIGSEVVDGEPTIRKED